MNFKSCFITIITLLFLQELSAQRNYDGYNFLGIYGGTTLFDINTDDLVTNSKMAFMAGFTTRGAFRNNFDLIYGISFHSAAIEIESGTFSDEDFQNIGYTMQGVQINFLGSYNIVPKHLSVEFGPVININGKLKLDEDKYKDYILSGYEALTANDIQDISKFNIHLAGGLTAGLKHFRVYGQYQYGLTNMLGNLNKNNLEKNDFKGNSSTIIFGGVIYF